MSLMHCQDLGSIVVDSASTIEIDLIWISQESLGHSKVDMVGLLLLAPGVIIGFILIVIILFARIIIFLLLVLLISLAVL
jgi:hypothetical protein